MSPKVIPIRKTYFGITSLIVSIVSAVFLTAYFAVSQLNISPDDFFFWNSLTLLISCLTGPMALILGVIGYRSQFDSKCLSITAIVLIALPFFILFAQFVLYFTFGR